MAAEQPEICEWQSHDSDLSKGQLLRQSICGPVGQEGQAGGMAADNRNAAAPLTGQASHHGHTPARLNCSFIDVQINPRTEPLSVIEKRRQGRSVGGGGREGWSQDTAKQATAIGHPASQGLTLGS